MRAFERQLGSQPGTQMNPILDGTDGFVAGAFDQVAAVVGRFPRGRIDKAFLVNQNNIRQKLGAPESISASQLNEAYVQCADALKAGTKAILVSRLHVAAAALSWVVFASAAASTFTVSATAPTGTYTFGVQSLDCNNDGIKIYVHADQVKVAGVAAPASVVKVRVVDADGQDMYAFSGSLNQSAVDESGNSYFIGDVSAQYTDALVWQVSSGATIAVGDDCYGKDANGLDKWASPANLLQTFTEGGTAYAATDYTVSVNQLRDAVPDFGYIMGAGTRAISLIAALADLGYQTNRQTVFDIDGTLTPAAAITFIQQFSFGGAGRDHYPQFYWAPVKGINPLNGARQVFGTSGDQVGQRCARNARTNSYGFAPKNYPVAGKATPLLRSGLIQTYTPTASELSDLAAAKINPVIFQTYNGGSACVYSDALTAANTVASYRKLITVAEMSADLDERVARYGKEVLLLPMSDAIKKMRDFLLTTFTGAQATGWLVPSSKTANGASFTFTVVPNAQQPADRMDVSYWLHYNGLTRQVFTQQTITA